MAKYQSANTQYAIRTLLFMGFYFAANVAAILLFDHLRGLSACALALTVSAPIIGQIWATLAFMRDSDEFVRALTARRFIVAAGIAMALFSAWGFMESYAHAPHAPGWLVYSLFWAAYGLVSPLIRTTR